MTETIQEKSEEQVVRSEANFTDLLRESVCNAGLNKRKSVDDDSEISEVTTCLNRHSESITGNKEAVDAVEDETLNSDSDVTKEKTQHPNESGINAERLSQSNPRRCVSVIGAILRIMGDEQYCRACGKHLRLMGDEIYCMYAARRMMSPLLLELAASDTMYY